MAPNFTEDEIDDLLYLARTGETEEFKTLKDELCQREKVDLAGLLERVKDDGSGNGILHMAAANGHNDFILQLCKALSNPPQNPAALAIINAQNKAGNTALHWAALNGHLESVKVLLEQGGDPTITNHRGHDAIYEAELNDKEEVVKWVLKEGGEGLEEGFGGENGEASGSGEADDEEMVDEEGGEGSSKDENAAPSDEDTRRMIEKLGQINVKDIGSAS